MSDAQKLSDRISRLLESEQQTDFASVFAAIEKINHRLDKLETSVTKPQPASANFQTIHPSQEKFDVIEAIADPITEGVKNEKACTFEPNGRPCDHCSMCSSRGF